MSVVQWQPSAAAKAAGDYFNSLPIEERGKLAPLLENYRQMGMAEAYEEVQRTARKLDSRIRGIQTQHDDVAGALRCGETGAIA